MLRAILSVGGWTLASRITGFLRDIVLAAVLGAGQLMDVFAVAFRLPNHFRAIFGEGAFNAAFVPAFTRIRTEAGDRPAALFHARILSLILLSQIVILALALVFTPTLVGLLAPGFAADQAKFALAVEVTRITFPYLLLITLVTLWSGVLNAAKHFAAAAAAPVLLNLSIMATVAVAFLFRTPAHAAGWGVALAGVLEAALLAYAARRAGLLVMPAAPVFDAEVKRFFTAFLPAVIGSAGTQIAMFADTILATLLPEGSASALYYADRIYQLPLGVIAIAAGTVLLPVMSEKIAGGDSAGAHAAQNRALGLTLILATPFWVAMLMVPEPIIRAVFERGAFDGRAAVAAASVLAAYGVGLVAAVSIRSVVASFHARGDTTTPMLVSLGAVLANVLLKIALSGVVGDLDLGIAGLALATALGATLNLAALIYLAIARGWMAPDASLVKAIAAAGAGAGALALALWLADRGLAAMIAGLPFAAQLRLGLLMLAGGAAYGAAALAVIRLTGLRLGRR
jgi:putative peptidoglycan lipid II flippase